MGAELVGQVQSTLEGKGNPYISGAWTPQYNEYNARYANGDATVIGEPPTVIHGVYESNGENQLKHPLRRYLVCADHGIIHPNLIRDDKMQQRN